MRRIGGWLLFFVMCSVLGLALSAWGAASGGGYPSWGQATAQRSEPGSDRTDLGEPGRTRGAAEVTPQGGGRDLELGRALAEAERNCGLLRDGTGTAVELCFWRALEAVRGSAALGRVSYGELDAMEAVLRHLTTGAARGRALGSWDGELRNQGWSFEDLRFVVGFFHWYFGGVLEHVGGKPGREHKHAACRAYESSKLKRFRGKDFDILLGEMD